MPLIASRGSGSAQGLGFSVFASAGGGGDGTIGIFAVGSTFSQGPRTVRNKYTYATCTSTACGVAASSRGSQLGSAAGNSTRGIFATGLCNACTYCGFATRNKYTYATDTSTACGVAAASNPGYGQSAAGNSTRGIFATGYRHPSARTTRNKYTYATCTSTACGVAASSVATGSGAAAGNSTRGIFQIGGTCGGGYTSTRDKYTYATCTSTAATAANDVGAYGSAIGNSTEGIFTLGNTISCRASKIRNKYTYATDTSTTGVPEFAFNMNQASGTGNSTRGILAIGNRFNSNTYVSTRCKYTYATGTATTCGVGAASCNAAGGSAASWATCVNS